MTAAIENKIIQMPSDGRAEALVAIKIRPNGMPRIQVVADKIDHKVLLVRSMQLAVDKLNKEIERDLSNCFSLSQSSKMFSAS